MKVQSEMHFFLIGAYSKEKVDGNSGKKYGWKSSGKKHLLFSGE